MGLCLLIWPDKSYQPWKATDCSPFCTILCDRTLASIGQHGHLSIGFYSTLPKCWV